MREVALRDRALPPAARSFLACLATVLELAPERLPDTGDEHDPVRGRIVSRWLGGLRLGLVPVADPVGFSWPGPWIARVRPPAGEPRYVVMYGVPSGVVWDPEGDGPVDREWADEGYVIAAADVALALPEPPPAPRATGVVEAIWLAPSAGDPGRSLPAAKALAGRGLDGDRHVTGAGTFPSGVPGSALTLIEAEVCESFAPPLEHGEHRRNVVTRGIELNALVGQEFTVGGVRCRGMRLCEPCTVIERRATRPLLRPLVHRGGLRADILADGEIRVGDAVVVGHGR